MNNCIAIPLSMDFSTSPILERERGDLVESIDHIIDLIVFTPKGTFSADPEFGFEFLNHEFSNINLNEFNNSYMEMDFGSTSLNETSRKQCEQSLKNSLHIYEPRLMAPDVRIELEANETMGMRKIGSKYKMRITIRGSIDAGAGVTRPYEKRISFKLEPCVKK